MQLSVDRQASPIEVDHPPIILEGPHRRLQNVLLRHQARAVVALALVVVVVERYVFDRHVHELRCHDARDEFRRRDAPVLAVIAPERHSDAPFPRPDRGADVANHSPHEQHELVAVRAHEPLLDVTVAPVVASNALIRIRVAEVAHVVVESLGEERLLAMI